jgi:DNA-binding response OmpR family regulator
LLESKRILLESRGHAVRTAASGAEALQVGREFEADVAILDLGLPDMSGHELANHLQGIPTLRETVFLALSGNDAELERTKSLDGGFYAHLVKPVDIDEIEAAVGEALRRARGRDAGFR